MISWNIHCAVRLSCQLSVPFFKFSSFLAWRIHLSYHSVKTCLWIRIDGWHYNWATRVPFLSHSTRLCRFLSIRYWETRVSISIKQLHQPKLFYSRGQEVVLPTSRTPRFGLHATRSSLAPQKQQKVLNPLFSWHFCDLLVFVGEKLG